MNTKGPNVIHRADLEIIDNQTRERYDRRLEEYGATAEALGWIHKDYQTHRFEELTRHVQLDGRSIIDVGCGFADLATFLRKSRIRVKSYLGIDINPRLIDVARKAHPDLEFRVGDPLLKKFNHKADIVTIIGIANYRFHVDNYLYMQQMLQSGFVMAKECLAVNMISNRLVAGVPVNPSVFHYTPEKILKMGLQVSAYVELIQDSIAMPQAELFVLLRRKAHGG